MIYFLFIALLILTGLAFILSNRNVLAPWVIICCMFTVSTFMAMLNAEYWDFTIDPITAVVILTALMAFGAGQLLVTHFSEQRQRVVCGGRTCPPPPKDMRRRSKKTDTPIEIPVWQTLLVCLVVLLMLVFYFYKKYQLSLAAGNPGGFGDMLTYVRAGELNFLSVGKVANIFALVAQMAAYLFAYVFLHNLVYCGLRLRWLVLLIPLVLFVPFEVLSAARTGFIRDIVFLVVVLCVLYQHRTHWNYWNTAKIALLAVAALLVFLIIFRLTGFLKDSGSGVSAFYSITKYMGGSIPCFNDFVLHPRDPSPYIGSNTLLPVYNILRQLGMDIPQFYAPYDFTDFATMSTNIYTGLRRYIEDYTYVGMYTIMLGLGALYGGAFQYIKNHPDARFGLLVYAVTCYPIFEMSIEERFFLNILSTTTVYQLIILSCFYYVFIYRKTRVRQILRPGAPVYRRCKRA